MNGDEHLERYRGAYYFLFVIFLRGLELNRTKLIVVGSILIILEEPISTLAMLSLSIHILIRPVAFAVM